MNDGLHVQTEVSHLAEDHEVTAVTVRIWPLPNDPNVHYAIKAVIEAAMAALFNTEQPRDLTKPH